MNEDIQAATPATTTPKSCGPDCSCSARTSEATTEITAEATPEKIECDCHKCDCHKCGCHKCDCQKCGCQKCGCQKCGCQKCEQANPANQSDHKATEGSLAGLGTPLSASAALLGAGLPLGLVGLGLGLGQDGQTLTGLNVGLFGLLGLPASVTLLTIGAALIRFPERRVELGLLSGAATLLLTLIGGLGLPLISPSAALSGQLSFAALTPLFLLTGWDLYRSGSWKKVK